MHIQFHSHSYSPADFYTETITLPIRIALSPTRIECRAFVTGHEISCCTNSKENIFCQPDKGIARVVLDIVNESDSNVSTWLQSRRRPQFCSPTRQQVPSKWRAAVLRREERSRLDWPHRRY
jgi:hypothetical protein